ncbi:MAG: hypothetical protein LBN71_03880, partial [Tannerella sp.]|nr:hypothetical protein [Tannerella sp.]
MNKAVLLFFLFCILSKIQAQEVQSLAGEWQFRLDSEASFSTIRLPGTTDEAGYGEKTTASDFGILTRAYKYIGAAW